VTLREMKIAVCCQIEMSRSPGRLASSFHEKAGRSQDGFVFLSVDPHLVTEPPLSPSFYPQALLSDGRSLPGGRPRYSRVTGHLK
jgi:hypothetical protein